MDQVLASNFCFGDSHSGAVHTTERAPLRSCPLVPWLPALLLPPAQLPGQTREGTQCGLWCRWQAANLFTSS